MKSLKTLLTAMSLLGLLGVSASGATIDRHIQAVSSASDPSEAIAAFSAGLTADPQSPALHEAYLRKMVGFGLAEVTAVQTEDLLELDADE